MRTIPLLPLAAVATAVLFFFGTGLHPVWMLTWLAPLPVLLACPWVSRRGAFLAAAIAWFVGSLNVWHYLLSNFAPLPLAFVFSAVPACLFGADVLLFRTFVLRGALWKAALVFPAFWVALEYLNNVSSPNATFSNLAYNQMNFLPILQIASLTGIWGISFCVCLLPAVVAAALDARAPAAKRRALASGAAVVLAAVIGFGLWRLNSTPAPVATVRVGLTATGIGTTFPHNDGAALPLFTKYADEAASLARQGARLIILPEKIGVVSDAATPQVDSLFASAATETQASILVGLDRGAAACRWNEARLYAPDRGLIAVYDKHHMVPVLENADRPGTSITVLSDHPGTWGIQICKDLDFPALSRQYGARRIGLLLAPSWDFTQDAWLHGRMAVLRGVESGFTIVRSAKQGLLTVSDDRGRILAERDASSQQLGSLVATAPIRHSDTLYQHCGDWFAWLSAALAIFLVIDTLTRRGSPSATVSFPTAPPARFPLC